MTPAVPKLETPSLSDTTQTALNQAIEEFDRIGREDLYLSSAGNCAAEQVELFDNVLERLIKTIEIRAIADIMAVFVVYGIRILLPALQSCSAQSHVRFFSEDRPSLGWLDRACPKGGELKPQDFACLISGRRVYERQTSCHAPAGNARSDHRSGSPD
jgi:hypothetical protein